MKRTWIAVTVLAGALEASMFGQQYPPQDPYQGDPNYNGQYAGNGDPGYYGDPQGVYAPAPPPVPGYAYQRPPIPGPGYYWIDGYWSFVRGRYVWVSGYWALPPYTGGYWVAPRYYSGRFFLGFWSRPHIDRGYVGNNYRYRSYVPAPRYNYRAPSQGRHEEFRGSDHRGGRH